MGWMKRWLRANTDRRRSESGFDGKENTVKVEVDQLKVVCKSLLRVMIDLQNEADATTAHQRILLNIEGTIHSWKFLQLLPGVAQSILSGRSTTISAPLWTRGFLELSQSGAGI